jgi:uncharacterized protein (TIGR03437 family)
LASLSVLAIPASAQLPSASSLSGVYSVRYLGANAGGSSDVAVSFSGTLTFDGKGGFTVTGQGTTSSGALTFTPSGSYSVLSSGVFFMNNPFDSSGGTLYGGIGSNGVITASATESVFVDTLVGVPQATSANNATLSGNYNIVSLEFLGGSFLAARDTYFSATANGSGSFGNVTVTGTAVSLSGTSTQQTNAGVTYSVSANGTGTVTFPAPSGVTAANVLISGAKVLAVSADGNFFIAGSQTGFDLVLGLKALPSGQTAALNGNYFSSYLQDYNPGQTDGGVYAAFGAANEIASLSNLELLQQRTNCDSCAAGYDQISDGAFQFTSNGTVNYTGDSWWAMGPNGDMAIGAGEGALNYSVTLYVRTAAMTPTGSVFLNPQGVISAASFAPFTSQYSQGEVISLFGTNIASAEATASAPFPTTLGNVQVLINGTAAPIYFVSAAAGQISAVIPYGVTANSSGLITFQVVNNNVKSNIVSGFLGSTSPGLFTVPANGVSNGAIEHGDGSLVSSSSPAKAGETVAMFLTGLGATSPAVTAGSAAPSSPLSKTTIPFVVYVGPCGSGTQATVAFAGLAPTLGGLYQVNFTIPSGLTSGTNYIEILTATDTAGDALDVDYCQASIPIGQ